MKRGCKWKQNSCLEVAGSDGRRKEGPGKGGKRKIHSPGGGWGLSPAHTGIWADVPSCFCLTPVERSPPWAGQGSNEALELQDPAVGSVLERKNAVLQQPRSWPCAPAPGTYQVENLSWINHPLVLLDKPLIALDKPFVPLDKPSIGAPGSTIRAPG